MIPYGRHHIDEDDIKAVADLVREGFLTQGPKVDAFEQAICKYVGSKYAVAVASGSAALHLASIAAGVGPGKNVLTSPITFVATALGAHYCGAKSYFADVDPATLNLGAYEIEKSLQTIPDIQAVIPVHYAGLPCNMQEISAVARAHDVVVIEDAAHALGGCYPDGSKVGCCKYSAMTVFSFHPVKAIAAGEGGVITTNDLSIYRRLLRLRSHGINKLDDPYLIAAQAETNGVHNPWYYEMQELGFHYRITDMQCVLATSQLKKLDMFMARRRALVGAYDTAFEAFKNCRPAQITGRDQSGHHIYVLRIDFSAIGLTRAELMNELLNRGIGSQVHYVPVPVHPYFQNRGASPSDYPRAMAFYDEALTIPLYFDLTDEQQAIVLENLLDLVG